MPPVSNKQQGNGGKPNQAPSPDPAEAKDPKPGPEVADEQKPQLPFAGVNNVDLPREVKFSGKTVTMIFKRKVHLTIEHGQFIKFREGIQEVPEEVADHYYLKDSGASRYVPETPKPEEAA